MENSTLWLAASEPVPGKEAEYNNWYNQHIEILFKNQALKKAGRYRCFQNMGKNKEECSIYLVFYEFKDDEALESFLRSPEMEAGIKDFEANGKSLMRNTWMARYKLIKILDREKKVEPIVWAVGISCNPKDEEEVNEWYHWKMDTLFKFKDLRGTRRYIFDQPMDDGKKDLPKYISMYELDNKEALGPFEQCSEYTEIGVPYIKKWKDNKDFIITWSGLHGPIKVLRRE